MIIRNDTLRFLLPLISSTRFSKKFLVNKHFIGAFIGDIDKFNYEYEIVLVYKIERTVAYHLFETQLMAHKNFSNISYYYEDKSLSVFVFKIPLEAEEDFDLILSGEYHKISPDSKLKIIKFWNPGKENKIFQVLIKPNEKWKSPSIDEEYFDIDQVDDTKLY